MIGVDLTSIKRIESLVKKYGIVFLKKILNDDEISLVKNKLDFNIHRIAGFFAAKEALSKALGCGIGKDLRFHDIHIHKNCNGAPKVSLSPTLMKKFNIKSIHLSISHDRDYAEAVVQIITLD